MPGMAAKVVISEVQQEVLKELARSRTAATRLVQRAQIILLSFEKHDNESISAIVGLNPLQVGRWRKRWKAAWEQLISIECAEGRPELRRAIERVLSDLPRSGRKRRISCEQQAAIVAIACESPEQSSERPISQWTHREIADEAVKRGVIEQISPRTVGTFLKSGRRAASPK